MWHPASAGSGSHDAPALLCTIDLLRKSLFPYLLRCLVHPLYASHLRPSFFYVYLHAYSYLIALHFSFQLLHSHSKPSLNHLHYSSPFHRLSSTFSRYQIEFRTLKYSFLTSRLRPLSPLPFLNIYLCTVTSPTCNYKYFN